jgi:translation initiation factor IF-1
VSSTRRGHESAGDPPEDVAPGRELAGVVVELLPSALHRVEIDGGHVVVAHVTGSPQRNFVRLVVGDRVMVALAPNDVGRGRIVRKL